MKVVVQRVTEANVEVDSKIVGNIDKGLVVLVGFTQEDSLETIKWMVNKIVNLRIFNDDNDIMNLSLKDIEGKILSIPQFTLYADTKKGNRPNYIKALNGDEASKLYREFNKYLKEENINVEEGIFAADMKVNLINDGPVTIIIEK